MFEVKIDMTPFQEMIDKLSKLKDFKLGEYLNSDVAPRIGQMLVQEAMSRSPVKSGSLKSAMAYKTVLYKAGNVLMLLVGADSKITFGNYRPGKYFHLVENDHDTRAVQVARTYVNKKGETKKRGQSWVARQKEKRRNQLKQMQIHNMGVNSGKKISIEGTHFFQAAMDARKNDVEQMLLEAIEKKFNELVK
jgi:hypothetical protein